MSRLVAYLGPTAPVSALLEDGTLPLMRQAEADSPDGFGIGWYPEDGDPSPVRILSLEPATHTPDIIDLTRRSSSRAILAGAYRATGQRSREALPPQTEGQLLYMQSGQIISFAPSLERALRRDLSERAYRTLSGSSEAELMFASFLDELGQGASADAIADALERTASKLSALAERQASPAGLAVVVSNGEALVTLRTATHGVPPPLYTIVADHGDPLPSGGRVIATEPTFNGSWTALATHSLTIFTNDEA